jgi:hypothetical protein
LEDLELDWIGLKLVIMSGGRRNKGGNGRKSEEKVKKRRICMCVPYLGYRRCGIVL